MLEPQREREPLDDVQRLEELALLREVQIGRVAGRIGQRAGIRDPAHEFANPSVVTTQLEDLVHHRAVFALQLLGQDAGGPLVRPGVNLHAEHAVGVGAARAGDGAVQACERDRESAPGKPHAFRDVRDDADARVGMVVPGNQQDLVVAPDIHRKRDRHPGKYHRVFHRNDS